MCSLHVKMETEMVPIVLLSLSEVSAVIDGDRDGRIRSAKDGLRIHESY